VGTKQMRVNEANKNKNLFTPKESRSSTTLGIPSSPPPNFPPHVSCMGESTQETGGRLTQVFHFQIAPSQFEPG